MRHALRSTPYVRTWPLSVLKLSAKVAVADPRYPTYVLVLPGSVHGLYVGQFNPV